MKAGVPKQASSEEGSSEKVKVYLRIRPLTEAEKERGEEQVRLCTVSTLLLP